MRRLDRTVITAYGRDIAVASTLFYRDSSPGKVGRQMQTWVRFAEGWKIVAAHVSVIADRVKTLVPRVDVGFGVRQVVLVAMGRRIRLDPAQHCEPAEQPREVGQQFGKLIVMAEYHHRPAEKRIDD